MTSIYHICNSFTRLFDEKNLICKMKIFCNELAISCINPRTFITSLWINVSIIFQ